MDEFDGRTRRWALRFILLLGMVSLFSDATYEGARSVVGPYLGTLGATGAVVGIVAGSGELAGYALRLVSGRMVDRTQRYWAMTLFGYAVNLGAVPLLALAGSWPLAALLVVAERVGKGVRTPVRDAMLSHASAHVGRGWGFGLHEAMDQAGALAGPLLVAGILWCRGDLRLAFTFLFFPAAVAMGILLVARRDYPRPRGLEGISSSVSTKGFPKHFWTYLLAASLVGAATTDFALIAFHFARVGAVSSVGIPILYAAAMGVDGVAALGFGRGFDRFGFRLLAASFLASAFFAPLVFLGGPAVAIPGLLLWGVGMGAQESIMRAAVAGMVGPERRASAYGMFNAIYGVAWFLGSALMGALYDVSLPSLVVFSVAAQLIALSVLLRIPVRAEQPPRRGGSRP